MRYRTLGKTGLKVSDISFGAWQLGNESDWAKMDDTFAHRLIDKAFNLGVNLFDTAPNYAGGNSERLLGEALEGRRDKVVVVSKFGHHPSGHVDFSPDRFRESLEASLRRLRTDYLDILLLHNPPFDLYSSDAPIWDALENARHQGKIRHYGASLDFAAEAEACLNNTGSEVLEILFNILHQDIRKAFPLFSTENIGTIVKVPLDSGWLTGRFDTNTRFRGIRSRWSNSQVVQRAELVKTLLWLTDDNSELLHKALSYTLSYDEISCVIPGTRTLEQLENAMKASGTRLSLADRSRLEAFWDQVTDHGHNLIPW